MAGELRSEATRSIRNFRDDPRMVVPLTVWVSIWEIFTTILLTVVWLTLTLSFVVASVGLGSAGILGAAVGASVESTLVWTQLAAVALGLCTGAGATLCYGLLAEKAWRFGLYVWTKPIILVVGILLLLTMPSPEGRGPLAVRMIQYLVLISAMCVQIYLVVAMRKRALLQG